MRQRSLFYSTIRPNAYISFESDDAYVKYCHLAIVFGSTETSNRRTHTHIMIYQMSYILFLLTFAIISQFMLFIYSSLEMSS